MKQYLGDSVYIEIENGMFKLTTKNSNIEGNDSNIIYLETLVYENMREYFESELCKTNLKED